MSGLLCHKGAGGSGNKWYQGREKGSRDGGAATSVHQSHLKILKQHLKIEQKKSWFWLIKNQKLKISCAVVEYVTFRLKEHWMESLLFKMPNKDPKTTTGFRWHIREAEFCSKTQRPEQQITQNKPNNLHLVTVGCGPRDIYSPTRVHVEASMCPSL